MTVALVRQDRLLIDHLLIGEVDECWSWNVKPHSSGYIYISCVGTGNVLGHRIIAELIYGDLGKKHVHHICENKACGNPAHLILIDESEHHHIHADPMKCEHGDSFRSTKKSGKTYCRECSRIRVREYRQRMRVV